MPDKIIYVCGEFSTNKVEDINAKHMILGSLATVFSVRTHPFIQSIDAGLDRTELFNTITRCHVFVFIYSKETVDDTYYLNQYGIAKAYGIPVIGVREPSYFMPNPLPEQFYFTEIVDYTGEIRDGNSNRGIPGPKKQFLLADALVQDFKTAMVYASEFHKSCFQRLLHKVSQAFNRTENEKTFYANLKEQQPQIMPFKDVSKAEKPKNKMIPKCPKCGFCFNKQLIIAPSLQRASSTGSLLRKGDAFEGESAAQKPQLQNKKPILQPTTISIPCPPYLIKNHDSKARTQLSSSATTTRNHGQKPIEPFKGKLQARSSMLHKVIQETVDKKQENTIPEFVPKGERKETEGENMDPNAKETRTLRKQSRISNASWADKLKLKLRRQSSLPVIPTTYLVTTPAGSDKQLSFVKYPPDSLSPRQSLLPIFSEDEEQETIHISRAPSPDGGSSCVVADHSKGAQSS
ncbi:uncharacterized protein LOC116286455 isoform X2 [Actinia tenebrosa]|uniref:Uncharacterized protein LOC116286455 isoform X2 n=1 Tax=Actinia tenebrosa TaxID=6105 RepID=A0A6P8GZ96_ACTTE|nr:uncharacterized protein LOC116286455 isoform X2 [Actinia tenebrosa]